MVMFATCLSTILIMVGNCFSAPVQVFPNGKDPNLFHGATEGNEDLSKASFPHIGSAVAPVVGAVVGPLLVNIANGITNGITSTITTGYEPLDFGHDPHPHGHYNVYLVHYDDESQPYLLLDSIKDEETVEYYGAASSHNGHYGLNHRLSQTDNHDDVTISTPEIVSVN